MGHFFSQIQLVFKISFGNSLSTIGFIMGFKGFDLASAKIIGTQDLVHQNFLCHGGQLALEELVE